MDQLNRNLCSRLLCREPEALGELYDQYGRLVYAVVHRIVGDSALAEDLTQEVFLRAWNRVEQLQEQRAIGGWLVVIGRNCALDYLKSSRAQHPMVSYNMEHEPVVPSFEKALVDAQDAEAVRAALLTLTPDQRRVIEMAYYEGLSQTEIADALHQPLGTVKSWNRIALLRLRQVMLQSYAI